MEQHLSKEVWVDGNEAGNELRFGIESMMATTVLLTSLTAASEQQTLLICSVGLRQLRWY